MIALRKIVSGCEFLAFLIAYAFFAGIITSFFLLLSRNVFFGESQDLTLAFGMGGTGIVIAFPLLLLVFLPWFYYSRGKAKLLKWIFTPTVSAALYSSLIGLGYLKIENLLLFSATGFLTSLFMWLTYKNVNVVRLNTTNLTNVETNASN